MSDTQIGIKDESGQDSKNMMKMVSLNEAKVWYNSLVEVAKEIMKKDIDFGVIPGVNKPSLLKPGAEKLRLFFGLQVKIERISEQVDLTSGYINYDYKASVYDRNGIFL